jgi:hypothetical protein
MRRHSSPANRLTTARRASAWRFQARNFSRRNASNRIGACLQRLFIASLKSSHRNRRASSGRSADCSWGLAARSMRAASVCRTSCTASRWSLESVCRSASACMLATWNPRARQRGDTQRHTVAPEYHRTLSDFRHKGNHNFATQSANLLGSGGRNRLADRNKRNLMEPFCQTSFPVG